jgi:RAQPRD family integrative conjugative element protein
MKCPAIVTRSRTRLAAVLIATAALAGATTPSLADVDAEREHLARISYELSQVQRMISAAAGTADASAGVRFRYDLLARDVGMVQAGIDDHLQRPRQPQRVAPLAGDYRN